MRTIKIYKFNELTPHARKLAIEQYRKNSVFKQKKDYLATVMAGSKLLNVDILNLSVNFKKGTVSFDMQNNNPIDVCMLRGGQLESYLLKMFEPYLEFPYQLTRFHGDESFFRPIKYMAGKDCSFTQLIDKCVRCVFEEAFYDYRVQMTDRYIINHIINKEFTEDGREVAI